ncbi:hypothetical protein BU26DRAFT_515709 [Trematosphaeria pertusa]|uniref:D-isomer specific 2-hydroxyacid dehydrogenase NAD-binding domain-containing protein n=1 Tax=Trematosphaeria pertusa TaxID=390896 RepID=A0A6A6IS60_9PLEO|nr:uncharacterized protein BU26DRAFT_515709 [Trematosphaeria pertusa]KAF2253341.1 hypothetical protein BU26DRAFT_515709 [Trematosphaeria pertusa]
MGGGPEYPQRGEHERELLLCVLPWPEKASEKVIGEIRDEFPNLEMHYIAQTYEDLKTGKTEVPEDLCKRASYLATLSWLPLHVSSVPNVKFIQFYSAGTNHVAKHPIYTDSKIPLCSASGVHGPQIAEWVIMMDLVHSHKYTILYDAQKRKEWKQKVGMEGVSDNVGKRVGVLGYGSIGRQVARVAKAMGMDVIAYTASPRPTPESRRDGGFIVPGTGDPEGEYPSAWFSGLNKDSLHEFLKQKIDLLVLSVPLTKETTHFLSTEEFALLNEVNPAGTYIANISRGQVIDQPTLVKALERKQIRGAALDVTDPEPLPADDPLWTAPNCLITPHVSGSTTVYAERAFQVLRENLRRERDGKHLVNEVDRDRGY